MIQLCIRLYSFRVILLVIPVALLSMSTASADDLTQYYLTNKNGRTVLPDSAVYEGQYRNGLFHGAGKLTWGNGDVYTGEFKHGMMHGKGTYKSATGDVYEGDYQNGLMHGQGVYSSDAAGKYTGSFRNDHFDGKGRYVNDNGDIYEGDFKKSAPNGKGSITFHDAGDYIGEIKKWKMHGQGIYSVVNGDVYSGQFVNGVQQGMGKIKYKSGEVYTGEVVNWQPQGVGELKSRNGDHYRGDFIAGLYHGEGVLTDKKGNVFKGKFENGSRHGKGTYTLKKPRGHKKIRTGWWEFGRYSGENKPDKKAKLKSVKKKRLDAESIFYKQPDLLEKSLANIKPSNPGVADLYMVSFGAYGQQDVFMNEAQYSKSLFDKQFGTEGRSLALINNPKVANSSLLASVTNLKRVLLHIAGIMDKDDDILFLFLTSHGSKSHELSVSLQGLPLNDLPATELAKVLKESKIKWKVIVVSSCYSGGFIKALKDDHTLVITSAKSDHVSFGCSDEAEFTFFGRAFFKQSVPAAASFVEAFTKAKALVTAWETKEDYDHSLPQIWTTEKIKAQLLKWRAQQASKVALDNPS